MSARHTPRLASFNYVGTYRYAFTLCTHGRRRVFVDREMINVVLSHCFMPDHVHLLVAGQAETSDANAFIARAKQLSGYWFKAAWHEVLWQKSSWDRILRSEEDTLTVVRYILLNPVRACLVRAPLDYPHSGSDVYSREDPMDAFRDWRA